MSRRSIRVPGGLLDRAMVCAEAVGLGRVEWLRRALVKVPGLRRMVDGVERVGWDVVCPRYEVAVTREGSRTMSLPRAVGEGLPGKRIVAAMGWAVEFCEARTPEPFEPPPGEVYVLAGEEGVPMRPGMEALRVILDEGITGCQAMANLAETVEDTLGDALVEMVLAQAECLGRGLAMVDDAMAKNEEGDG